MAAKTVIVAEKLQVYLVSGRPYSLWNGEGERPATAIDALVGARLRVLIPQSFPIVPADNPAT